MLTDDRLRAGLATILDDAAPDVDAALTAVLRRAGRRRRVRRAAYSVGLVAAAVVTAVTVGLGGGEARRTIQPARHHDAVQVLDHRRGGAGSPVPLVPGAYAIPFIGAPEDAPWAQVTVPAGWGQDRLILATGPDLDPHVRGVELLAVDWVATDPCLGGSHDVTTVADVVTALTAQRAVDPSRARSVSLGGYAGQLVEFHASRSLDVTKCPGHSLTPFGYGAAHTEVFPGWTYRTWVLDVDGTPLVVMAIHGPATTATELEQLNGIVHDLTFIPPR